MGENARTTFYAVTDLYGDAGRAVEKDVGAGSELDESNALAAIETISDFGVKYDATSQESSDLLEDHGLSVTLNGDDILLVLIGAILAAGVEEFSTLVSDVTDHPGNRSAIHVDIEHAEEDANAPQLLAAERHRGNVGHFAVRRGDKCAFVGGNCSLGITEKPKEECRQQEWEDCPGGMGQPSDQKTGGDQRKSVKVAITNHGELFHYIWQDAQAHLAHAA